MKSGMGFFQYVVDRLSGSMRISTFCLALLGAVVSVSGSQAKTDDGRLLVYYSMSFAGNTWQTEAMNALVAMSKTPAFAGKVELRVQQSGADAQRQIQQLGEMIGAGADAIIVYPISPTALNGVIKQACARDIVVVVINGVTEPCSYTLKTDAVEIGKARTKWVVDYLKGQGTILDFIGIPGISFSDDAEKGLEEVVAANPGIKVAARLEGKWSDQETRLKMREYLATHTWADINGIVAQAGCGTLFAMQVEDGWVPANPVIPCAGEAENGSRVKMLPVDSGVKGAMGAPGVSVGSGLFGVPYALKVAVEVIEGKDHPHVITYDAVEVSSDNIKLCTTASAEDFAGGCNTIDPSVVPDDYFTDFWSPLTPEIGIKAVQTGEPD